MNSTISPNIILKENSSWGNPHYDVIRSLLYMVDTNMMTALDCHCFSTKKCFVLYHEDLIPNHLCVYKKCLVSHSLSII